MTQFNITPVSFLLIVAVCATWTSGCNLWPASSESSITESWTEQWRPKDEPAPRGTGLDPRAKAIERNLGIN
ncbi:MAG: hypothetical protein P8N76_10380 [Pirellulaceae bacterium]|nr:hypothetical protein [Pirellulaceae bacterium]